MRYILSALFIFLFGILNAQITLPAYQGLQMAAGPKKTPDVEQQGLTTVTATSIGVYGNVISEGASSITAKGICWGTSPSPTLGAGNYTTDEAETGPYINDATGLTKMTIYYLRPYATNSFGTAYGTELVVRTPPAVGDVYQGGKVISTIGPSDGSFNALVPHGFSVSQVDLSNGTTWSNNTNNLNGTNTGGGLSNTNAIVADQGAGTYAAKLCYDYSIVDADGITRDDWYLPNRNELNTLYNTKASVNAGYANQYYWSSSQKVNTTATAKHFGTGNPQDYAKSSNFIAVRAVRGF